MYKVSKSIKWIILAVVILVNALFIYAYFLGQTMITRSNKTNIQMAMTYFLSDLHRARMGMIEKSYLNNNGFNIQSVYIKESLAQSAGLMTGLAPILYEKYNTTYPFVISQIITNLANLIPPYYPGNNALTKHEITQTISWITYCYDVMSVDQNDYVKGLISNGKQIIYKSPIIYR
ncbi:hypothetical protein [Ferroacidibacillus organovorans]|uniref:Uncharacterized protein n=1 Tax=Ferroacidibacillus organovorans TaxID=1765683 RepID=A0A1V4EV09_9BACL|nr:hypothetical protein [Ferroacidibacillus organovorans]OPG16765.1 hypothetical protein B2M26_05250 [Ferroacidibacillus organovorans]